MYKHKFTVVTQLHENTNQYLIEYLESSRSEYAKAVRETFQVIKSSRDFSKSKFNTYLQNSYGTTKRTANSIILDAQGRINALKELKATEKVQLERKIEYLEYNVIPKLEQARNDNSNMLRLGLPISLVSQRNLRRKVVAKKQKLNRLKQKLANLEYQLETSKLKLCFGTKYLLQKDYKTFKEHRDSQMSFVGSKTETACNNQLQLKYIAQNNQFELQLRKDFGGFKDAKGSERYVFGRVYFRNHAKKIVNILKNKNSPLSFKIIKRNSRFYLYCTFEIQVGEKDFLTRSTNGTIGLDFNKGFITLSETNQNGHLVQTKFLPYRFKSGNKTKSDLQQIISKVVILALGSGKDLCIEDLNFSNTKAKTETKQSKKYNEMLHSLAYRQFADSISYASYRNRVFVRKVNPAWTSWIAEQKYCPQMKLNTHVGASFVIARRGQGYKDTV
jgi:IS605 OrfB family transposase